MTPRALYPAHRCYVAPAAASAEVWRLGLGIVLASAGYLALGQMFVQQVSVLSGGVPAARLFDGTRPGGMLLLLSSFGCMLAATFIVVRLLHRRGVATLFGPLPLALRQGAAVGVLLALLGLALMVLPPWDAGGPLVPNLGLGTWLLLLVPAIPALLVQVGAEEVFFRGYIQQQLAARFASPLVWMVLPAGLFALGHYLPDTAGPNAGAIALWSGLFGLLMADLTARAGTLGPAIAVHFYNNFTAMLLVSMPDDLGGLALYHAPFGMDDTARIAAWMPVEFAHAVVAWLAARLAIRA